MSPRLIEGRRTLDVSALPAVVVDSRAVTWWGLVTMLLIEGTMLAMTTAAYLYLAAKSPAWPPYRVPFPPIGPSTLTMAVLLLSLYPTVVLDRAAKANDLRRVRLGLYGNVLLAMVAMGLRFLEIGKLPFKWNSHAYGSAVWALVTLHTGHIIASTVETLVLVFLLWSRPLAKKHLLDMRVDALYWYFIVLAWLPIYFMLVWGPRIGPSGP